MTSTGKIDIIIRVQLRLFQHSDPVIGIHFPQLSLAESRPAQFIPTAAVPGILRQQTSGIPDTSQKS
jgi:hypothetical protein